MKKTIPLFWITLIFLILSQYIFTVNSFSQIRYEELAESVRNVFWLQQHTLYDGVSSNIGWYGTMLVIYNVLGFSLNAAKYYRFILAAISLICLALTLRKFFGSQKSLIPLITIGLSPTLLYFNTLQTSYGLDLQYVPIILYLIFSLDFSKKSWFFIKQILIGSLTMIAWMSYPIILFYLPALSTLYFYKMFQGFKDKKRFKIFLGIFITAASFLLPLVVGILYVKDRSLLFYDNVTQSGIFRGAGNLDLNGSTYFYNISHTLSDLVVAANSYYYEVSITDFSGIIPFFAVFISLLISLFLIKIDSKRRLIIILIWSVLILNLLLGNLAFDPSGRPGIRRNTAFLAAIYTLVTLLWYYLLVLKKNFLGLKTALIILLLAIPLHHLIAFPINLSNITTVSPYQYGLGFQLAATPSKSLDLLIKKTKSEDLQLVCQDQKGNKVFCRYPEMYAAVAGACLWNQLNCHGVLGYDPKTDKFIPLSINLWETYYWEH